MRKSALPLAMFVVLAVIMCMNGGCTATTVDSARTLDKQLYDTIFVAQAVIEQAKAEAGTIPGSTAKVNEAIALYNQSLDAYIEFHTALDAGTAIAAKETAVRDKVILLIAELARLREFMHHTPPEVTP